MDDTTTTSTDPRADYIAGLRALADLLESTEELPLPNTDTVYWYLFGSANLTLEEQKTEALRIVRMLPGKQDKETTGDLYRLTGHVRGLQTQVIVERDAVCERVVVGTRTVEVEEPDPEAVAALPKVRRTEVVEQVEWRCHPLLADAEPEPVAS